MRDEVRGETRDGQGTPLRPDAQRNRERILEVALAELTRAADAPLSTIAKKAGVGQGTFYRNFPNREALVLEVYRFEMQQVADTAAQLLSTRAPDRALREWMDRLAQYAMAKAGLADALRKSTSNSGSTLAKLGHGPVTRAVTLLLTANEQAGTIRPGVTPDDFVLAIAGLWQIDPHTDWQPRATRLLDLVMDGLRAGAPGVGASWYGSLRCDGLTPPREAARFCSFVPTLFALPVPGTPVRGQAGSMPFADEVAPVAVLEYQPRWPVDFERPAGGCTTLWEARRTRSTTSDPHRCRAWRPRTAWTSRCASPRSRKPGRSGSSPRSASVAGPSRGIEPRSRPDRNAASWCSPHRRVRGGATYTCAGKATRTAVTRSCSATTCGPTRLPDSSGGVQTTAGPQRAGPSGQRADQGPGHRDPDDRGRALGGGNGLAVASGEPRTARVPRDVSGLLQHPCRDREDQGGASAWFGARPVRRVRG